MNGWDDRDEDEPEDEASPGNLPAPWEQPDYGADADPPLRQRHDAFTPARRAKFLRHLAKYGCLTDAARRTGVAVRTVYRHQDKDEDFARHVALATQMAAGGVELVAWERAVAGVEEQFACGGKVYTRRRYSESLLRLFLQATNPKKYGPRPGFTRKRLMAWERKKIDREVRAKIAAEQPTFEESIEILSHKLDMMARVEEPKKLAAGWVKDEDGNWIPPGWVRADGGAAGAGESREGDRTPRDSL